MPLSGAIILQFDGGSIAMPASRLPAVPMALGAALGAFLGNERNGEENKEQRQNDWLHVLVRTRKCAALLRIWIY